jgi:putative addiction module component (TIGR02574 family)
MAVSAKALGLDTLPIAERVALVQEIWASIASEPEAFQMTDAQRIELGRRVADDDANPEDVVSAEEVFASARARLAKRQ